MPEINKYKVEITPLIKTDTYKATATDYTEYVLYNGIADISQKADSTDFDIGVYTYNYVDITFSNMNGYFSDIDMGATRFKYGRDKAKVTISYRDIDGNYSVVFKGIINDEFTQQDFSKNTVKCRVMSYDSIFRKLASEVGTVASGQTIKQAFINLLNRGSVTSLLNYDVDNINPVLNLIIDDATPLYNVSFKEAMDLLLMASCSVMFIDEDDNIIVRSRAQSSDLMAEFWNTGDLLGRNNILSIESYNSGLQRSFNLFTINEVSAISDASVAVNGLREKDLSAVADMITDTEKRQEIVDTYRDLFASPKKELKLTIKTELAKALKLFDMVTVGYQNRPVKRDKAPFLYVGDMPVDTAYSMPYLLEGQKVNQNMGFKIIEKTIKSDRLLTTLKLREIGTAVGDSILEFLLDETGGYILDEGNNRILTI